MNAFLFKTEKVKFAYCQSTFSQSKKMTYANVVDNNQK